MTENGRAAFVEYWQHMTDLQKNFLKMLNSLGIARRARMAESPYDLTSAQNHRFGQALIALPGQYVKVLTRPSIKAFVEEKEKGN